MELDNFSSGSRKRLDLNRSSRPFDVALPGLPADSESLLRRDVSRQLLQAKKKVIEEPFDSRLLEANQEFASLLHEASALAKCSLTRQRRSSSAILMRAVRCPASQGILLAKPGQLAIG